MWTQGRFLMPDGLKLFPDPVFGVEGEPVSQTDPPEER